jgi:ferredoxin-NADP reductase/predicted pyridoxine 5'-phosphate oxidase superfamily flavin-nucleotide-binding protein
LQFLEALCKGAFDMGRAYTDIAFTPAVRAMQTRMGTRSVYAALDRTDERRDALTADEIQFIHERDAFYQATVGESGWPYVQHRGGPAGFLKVLDAKTLGYADFRGNVQYISVGNLQGNDRVSILLMDYANQRRLKILGRARLVDVKADPALIARLQVAGDLTGSTRIERAVIISVEGYDWNCPKHITPRFTEAEIEEGIAPLRAEIERLSKAHAGAKAVSSVTQLGHGSLALRIAGIRQLTPRVRAYELRAVDGAHLPQFDAGSAIDVPVRLKGGVESTRRYSLASDPNRCDAYEIAVLRDDDGNGGSSAVHTDFQLGMELRCGQPTNDFNLHGDEHPAVLIAGGIGITPIKAMVLELRARGQKVELHYAVRSRNEAAYLAELHEVLGSGLHVYPADERQRLNVTLAISSAAASAVFYTCGPQRLIDAVRAAASAAGVDESRVRFERFSSTPTSANNRALTVTLHRSGQRIDVAPGQSILEAVESAGVTALSGCRNGTCGTCRVRVLGGDPEHRDTALTEAQRNTEGLMCICVSRAADAADLTLDL